jgi:hypothetical protein
MSQSDKDLTPPAQDLYEQYARETNISAKTLQGATTLED